METVMNMTIDKKLIISIVQAIYIIYMFNYFETTYSFETSRQLLLSGIFLHPIKDSTYPVSHICPFGHMMAYPIAVYLIGRNFVLNNDPRLSKKMNYLVLMLIFVGSLMNINAIVYLIPYFITEIYLNMYL